MEFNSRDREKNCQQSDAIAYQKLINKSIHKMQQQYQ